MFDEFSSTMLQFTLLISALETLCQFVQPRYKCSAKMEAPECPGKGPFFYSRPAITTITSSPHFVVFLFLPVITTTGFVDAAR